MTYSITTSGGYSFGRFNAMASPCEVLTEVEDTSQARHLLQLVLTETKRIEQKFSRYLPDNIIYKINHSQSRLIKVDAETARLLDYAQKCYELSEGLFDISSGVLGQIWHFDGSDKLPTQEQIQECLAKTGWNKIEWDQTSIRVAEGMQIDLGGLGKEYAVDRCVDLLRNETDASCLVNFGGDIATTGPRQNGSGWVIGLEHPDTNIRNDDIAIARLELNRGAIATSGDSRRYLLKDGVRYSHILNPKTGWPVQQAPRSVTVQADTCTEAGILSTFAMLQGNNAESFLEEQAINFWCVR